MGLPQGGVGGPGGAGTATPGKKVDPNDPYALDQPGQGDPLAFNPNDPYTQRITGNPNAGDHPAVPTPPPPPPGPPPAPPPAGPPAVGALSGPGPFETHAGELADPLNKPSAAEQFYGKYGSDLPGTKSYSEQLYEQGIGGLDPYYDYAQQKATKQINDAAAARGGFNSGAAIYEIGNSAANLRGQQARDMLGLAGQADSQKLGRYGAGLGEATASDTGLLNRTGAAASLYGAWQDREEGRLKGALSGQMDLSGANAEQIQKFYSNLMGAGKFDAEAINAALQAAGVDPNSAFAKDLISTGQAIGKAYLSGGMGK